MSLILDTFQVRPTTALSEPPDLVLRIWYGQQFLDVDSETVLPGPRDFYIELPCSIASDFITVSSGAIYTTLDAQIDTPQSIQVFARFYSGNTAKDWLFTGWAIPGETSYPGGTITFAQLTIWNEGNVIVNPPATYWTSAQVTNYFNTLSPAPDASVNTKGITKLTVAPASATNPIAVGGNDYAAVAHNGITALSVAPAVAASPIAVGKNDYSTTSNHGIGRVSTAPASATEPIFYGINDTHLPTTSTNVFWASQYASFAAAISAIGATPATLIISAAMTGISTVTVPSTLTLMFLASGSIAPTTGQTITIAGSIIAPTGKQIFANATSGQGTIAFTGNTSIGRYYIDWWGTPAGSDDSAICQAAATAFPANAYIKLVPGRTYATRHLTVKRGQTWDLSGATMIALITNTGADNQLFGIGNVGEPHFATWTSTALSSATAGATSLTVTSSASFAAGDRIIVSGGTFTGSGVEEGPIDFYSIASIPDATHIVVTSPMAYNYSGFGLPGATGQMVYKVPSTNPSNVRIFGGTIQPHASFNSIYFNIQGVENIEIDHILMNGLANGINTGGYVSGFNFHDNVLTGTASVSSSVTHNFASLVRSRIVNNVYNAIGTLSGVSNLEVTCHDNLVQGNTFGPLKGTAGSAIEFNKYSFNNQIIGNRIWGLSTDVNTVFTLGIRTYAVGVPANTGNIIVGNFITNVFQAIGDTADHSVIEGNSLYSVTSASTSKGIVTNSLKGTIGNNTIVGFDLNTIDAALTGVPTLRTTLGRSYMFEGNGSPEGVVTAPISSLYRRLDGGANTSLYIKQSGVGNTGWNAVTP